MQIVNSYIYCNRFLRGSGYQLFVYRWLIKGTAVFLQMALCFYVSQFTVETCCFADGRCLFKQPQSVIHHWNQYDEISKKCRSVRLSVCLSVCKLTKSLLLLHY